MRKDILKLWLIAILVVMCLLLAFPPTITAQQATGKIVGTITDTSGALLPDVKITVINRATQVNYPTHSDKVGYFEVMNLPIGDYQITAEREGFKKVVSTTPPLQINQVLRVDLQMQVGSRQETLTVEAAVAGVETVNATLGASVTSRPVIDMPLNGRNVLDLALLQPGVTEMNPGATDNHQAGTFGIAGGKSDSVTFLLDGGINNSLLANEVVYAPNPDTVAEFRILTSNYSAEYGRNASGIISVVTKSGTNDLHGSAYDFLRNEALNANSFFNNRAGLPREVLKRNQFGFTLGGPVVVPHVINGRNKFFWFASYQGQRQTQVQTTDALPVFTPLEIQGNFSQSGPGGTPDTMVATFLQNHPYWQADPALAAQGIIDPTKINPTAELYIQNNLVPVSAGAQIFSEKVQGLSKDDSDQFTAKLDAEVSSKDKLSLTLGTGRNPILNPFSFVFGSQPTDALGYGSLGNHHRYFVNLAWNRSFSSTLLNEVRFTAQRLNIAQAFPAKKIPGAAQLGVGITPDETTGPPRIFFNRGLDLGFSPQGPTTEIDNTYSWTDTLSWVKGKHTMKFGFLFSPYQNNTHYDFYVNGEFDFYGTGLFNSNTGLCEGAGSCNDFADFLFGLPDEYFQFGAAPSNIRSKSYHAFAQDEWRVTKKLTLSFGLRYEYNSPKLDTQGRSFSLVFGRQSMRFVNAPVGLLFPGDQGAPRGANFPDRNNFAPRFGFAWDPRGNGKTSIRGGFGVFYDILKGEDNLQFNGQAPFFGYTDLLFSALPGNPSADPGYFSDPFGVTGSVNPFPSKPPASNIDFMASGFLPFGGSGVYFVDPHLRTPYIYQYNLSVQHELAKQLTAEVSYVGNNTHKQTALVDRNPFILGTLARRFNTQPGLDPSGDNGFSYLNTFDNVVNGHYNSLEASLTKQLSETAWLGNTYFTLSYTWGKSIDDASGFRNVNGQVPAYSPGLFRSVADYDITHRIAFSGGWDLPFDRAWASGPKRLVKGWSLYPIVTYRTGFPMDIFAQLPTRRTDPGPSGAGDAGIVRVNMTGTTPYYDPRQTRTFNGTTGSFWFNPEIFDATFDPLVPTYGSYPRNHLRGPSRANFDFAIAKKTPLVGERFNAEFRAEFFNILNRAQFDLPNLTYGDPSFGQVTGTAPPRIIQLALRLTF